MSDELLKIDEDDAAEYEAAPATKHDYESLAKDVAVMQELTAQAYKADLSLKEINKKLLEITDKIIPDKMLSMNIKSMKLFDGGELKIDEILGVSIKKVEQLNAFTWLRDREEGDIIKNEITAKFGAEQDEEAEEFHQELVDQGLTVSKKQFIHPSTLKAFVKEQRKKGVVFPPSFTIFEGLRAKIVKPKS